MTERDFKGVWIPREVWLDERLSMLDKGILTEIDSLDIGDSGCFASNAYLAEFCQCTERKVSDAISKLIDLGYIRVLSFDGRTRKLRSCIEKISRQTGKNCEADTKKIPPNNTNNNTSNKSISSIDDSLQAFAAFWKVYPRHEAKQDAIKAWKALKPSDDLCATIDADIHRRLRDGGAWYKTERKFIPLPATYLRGKRWEDEAQSETEHVEEQTDHPVHWSQLPYAEQCRLQEEAEERERRGELFGSRK